MQRVEHAARGVFGGLLDRAIQLLRRGQGQAEDSPAMVIFHERIDSGLARTPAHRKDAQFSSERNEALEHKRRMLRRFSISRVPRRIGFRQFVSGSGDIFRGAQNPLPLAVVSHAAGFQNRGQTNLFDRGIERFPVGDFGKFRNGDAKLLEEALFVEAILRGFERGGRRKHGHALGKETRRLDRHVFKFVGDQLQSGGKFLQGGIVVVWGGDARGDSPDRSFRRGVEKTEAKTQRIAREREHVSELPAAENADRHPRVPFFTGAFGSGLARTRPVCALRNFRYASRTSGCFAPRMAAASKAALIAPAFPIAIVPTGTPPGIWAMERSESKPFSVFDSTGTPSTGSTVFEAVIPGRCAAPPAPAMITSIPRFSPVEAYSKRRSGLRCADTTRVSYGTPSSSSVFAACSRVSQSEEDPMMIPTKGLFPTQTESFALLACTQHERT